MLERVEDNLATLVALLPATARDELAKGPMGDGEEINGHTCRVCAALDVGDGELDPVSGDPTVSMEPGSIAEMLWDYHAEEGQEGDAVYERCCAIYRAAGWLG